VLLKQRPAPTLVRFSKYFAVVRFEVFTAVTMKNGVFWVVTLCGSYGVTSQKTPFFMFCGFQRQYAWENLPSEIMILVAYNFV
jgi:hypothetical protein